MRPLRYVLFIACWVGSSGLGMAQKKPKKDHLVTLTTDQGIIELVLFDQTPLHKANFLRLVEAKFYDGLEFHRIIERFMIQGGDPRTRIVAAGADSASLQAGVNYTVEAEFRPELFHRKGAVAAARDNNPAKASSGSQFYIVQGRVWDEENLEKQVKRAFRMPTEAQKQVYRTLGGSPHLDGGYTVFGQVVSGLEVVDKIAATPRNKQDRPLSPVRMQVTAKLVKRKYLRRTYADYQG